MALLDPIMGYIENVEEFSDYPVVAQNISRGRIITTIQASVKIWTFKLKIATPPLAWPNYYDFLEDLRAINTATAFTFNWLANPNLAYLTPYRGTLTATEQAAVTVAAKGLASPIQLNLANLPLNRVNAFRKGDYIQAMGDVKPYTVTADVTSTATGTATLLLNRPLFTYPATGATLLYGNAVTWTCYFSQLPTPSSMGQFIQGLQWSGNFEFTETA